METTLTTLQTATRTPRGSGSVASGLGTRWRGGSAVYFFDYYCTVVLLALMPMAAVRGTQDLAAFVWGTVAARVILIWTSVSVFGLTAAATSLGPADLRCGPDLAPVGRAEVLR